MNKLNWFSRTDDQSIFNLDASQSSGHEKLTLEPTEIQNTQKKIALLEGVIRSFLREGKQPHGPI